MLCKNRSFTVIAALEFALGLSFVKEVIADVYQQDRLHFP
jgi:hypothetical protein